MGGMPVVEGDVEAVEVLLAAPCDLSDELLGFFSGLLRSKHDRRAVRVVGADEVHFVPLHALEPHPDVGLDVLHDVADVKRAVRVGESGGDEQPAGHADFQKTIILPPRAGDWRRAPTYSSTIAVAMTSATMTVAAKIRFSRGPHGCSPARSARSRDIEVADMLLVSTNSVVPSAPICRIRRWVASCESNASEMPLVGEGPCATPSPGSRSGICSLGAAAPWAASGIGRVAIRPAPAPGWPVSICIRHSRRSFAKSA